MGITKQEYIQRYDRFHHEVVNNFDLAVVYTNGNRNMYGNLLYLTGYYSFDPVIQGALLVPATGEPHLLLNFEWDLDRAAKTSWIPRSQMSWDRDLGNGLINYCHEKGFTSGKIGVVGDTYMPSSLFDKLRRNLPNADFIPATSLVERQRMRKSTAEIDLLRKAARITGEAILAGVGELKQNVTEIEILSTSIKYMLDNQAEEIAFTPQVSFGEMTEVCMAPASNNVLQNGDLIMFDMGCLHEHYVGDLSRSRVFGQPTKEQQKIYDLILRAQEKAIDAVAPGKTGGEIDSIARKTIADEGYGKFFNHWLGRGIGLDLHERPFIEQGDTMVLEPGMVFSIEPGIYIPGLGGVRVEETILVTENGHEVLSDINQREFIVKEK